jgi:hypothetical protein
VVQTLAQTLLEKIVSNPAGHRSMETKYTISCPDPLSDCLKMQNSQAAQKW